MINRIEIEGRLIDAPIMKPCYEDPERRYASFRVLHTGHTMKMSFECVCFHNESCKFIMKFLKKGARVLVIGKMSEFRYTDPTGKMKKITNIIIKHEDMIKVINIQKVPSEQIKQEIGHPGSRIEEKQAL